jgi:hypothetical protein
MFLPPNTTSLIQPVDQDVIATFLSYYLQKMFIQLVKNTTDSEDKLPVKYF